MNEIEFNDIRMKVVEAGYEEEIIWQQQLKECETVADFFMETCWVILNSGMREQICRVIWNRIQEAWDNGIDISNVFNHKGKVAAIKHVKKNKERLFSEYQKAENKIDYLLTIPFIGKITCWHLAKNLGQDCVKPDRHLVRVSEVYNTTPDALCERISSMTGEKKSVVDIIIWRACNLGLL